MMLDSKRRIEVKYTIPSEEYYRCSLFSPAFDRRTECCWQPFLQLIFQFVTIAAGKKYVKMMVNFH